jgi:oligo-1,6-glucosidase
MQWDTTENAGFSKVKPWMRVHDDYKEWNVEVQRKDPKSVFSFYKNLLQVKKDNLVMVSDSLLRHRPTVPHAQFGLAFTIKTYGNFTIVDYENESVFAFIKAYKDTKLLVVLNFSNDKQSFEVDSKLATSDAKLLVGTMDKGEIKEGRVELEPWEGVSFSL